LVLAELEEFGFEGFEELEDGTVRGFLPAEDFTEDLAALCADWQAEGCAVVQTKIAPQNWNAAWEEAYEPVSVDDFCHIHAYFHEPQPGFQFNIQITPKMSFGTGHHATTRLVLRLLRELDCKGKRVLDYGCGTGVLAIVAGLLGAESLLGLDIEPWAVENTVENAQQNGVEIQAYEGGLEVLASEAQYDLILANINRNILLDNMAQLGQHAAAGSILLLSGFYHQDIPDLLASAQQTGFSLLEQRSEENSPWVALSLRYEG
jgi:ribosomal protein L11 methyltransferase